MTPCNFFVEKRREGRRRQLMDIGLEEIAPLLVRESAYKIVIPLHSCGWTKEYINYLRNLKYPLNKHIKPVDYSGSLASRIKRYLQPVEDWLLARFNTEADGLSDCWALNDIAYFLYLFKIGVDEQAQVDMHVPEVLDAMKQLTEKITDLEARIRLEQVAGIINLYEESSIYTFTYVPEIDSVSMNDRIDDLLDEAEMVEISKTRHSLGVPRINTELRLAWLRTKLWYRSVLQKREYRKFLDLSSEIIRYISKYMGKEIPKLDIAFFDTYSYRPPLIDLKPILVKGLSEKYQKPIGSWRGLVGG